MGLHWDPRILALRPLEPKKALQICPCQLLTASGVSVSGVLVGGEVLGGEGSMLHNLQRLLNMMGGDVLEEQ
jgi:hypothetical protein